MSRPAGREQGRRVHELAGQQDRGLARAEVEPARVPPRLGHGRLRGRGRRAARRGTQPGIAVQPHHRLRGRPLHRRLHRVLLHDQQRPERVPARQVRRWLVARRLLQLLQRHPLLHRLHAELLRPEPRQRLLRRLHRVPLRRRLQHAPRVLQLLPVRAVPPGDRHHRPDRVPGGHVHAAVRRRVAGVHHRARGRQLHRRARARARLHASAATARRCAAVLPSTGAAAAAARARSAVFVRSADCNVVYRELTGGSWGPFGVARAVGQLRPDDGDRLGSGSTCSGAASDDSIWCQRNGRQRRGRGWQIAPRQRRLRPRRGQRRLDGIYVFVRGVGRRGSGCSTATPAAVDRVRQPRGRRDLRSGRAWRPLRRLRVRHAAATLALLPAVQRQSWSGWQALGGAATSDPRRSRRRPGSICSSAARDDLRVLPAPSGGAWTAWATLGGGTSRPTRPRSAILGRVRVRPRATTTRSTTSSRVAGRGPGGRPLGGAATASPVAVGDSTGVYVFVRGSDSALWYQRLVAGAWSGWQSLGGPSAPVRGVPLSACSARARRSSAGIACACSLAVGRSGVRTDASAARSATSRRRSRRRAEGRAPQRSVPRSTTGWRCSSGTDRPRRHGSTSSPLTATRGTAGRW